LVDTARHATATVKVIQGLPFDPLVEIAKWVCKILGCRNSLPNNEIIVQSNIILDFFG
jgi:hypothetical protein